MSGERNCSAREADGDLYNQIDQIGDFEDGDEEVDGDLYDQVSRLGEEKDSEDGPDWMFDEDETRSPDAQYIFCPAEHRRQILHMFTKHFCQHPVFPDCKKDGKWSAAEIRNNAVWDMYRFCQQHGLCEVWGYMWANWYSPKMWRLWARSTSPYVSRIRTTMAVENFWRQLKHNWLHQHFRPRLDHLVWILIHKVTPAFISRSEVLQDHYRLGRVRPLTTYQRYFKKSWAKLATKDISGATYETNIKDWTCTCGQQKYDCHHLCKHLVQAVSAPPVRFWREVRWRRVVPLYRHPNLVAIGENKGEYVEPDGGITDGDD